ncbi:NB-ARC domains-containing protein [Artemisia annua]|uniref:NB-ARC domains-containing protein n=1 Tax=Artemisia annua TaxID=35608 RepID=A0A2U1LQF8_ARTAN|nr:NB-ARC domains-containing protein [Artemisia annua]
MAEIIASALIETIFQKLANEAFKQVARAQGIQPELKKLERTLFQIQALLNDASQKEITEKAVQQWLNDLRHLAYDIDDILDDLATDAMHREFTKKTGSKVRKFIPTCCTNFLLSTRMNPKLDKITNKIQDLEKEKTSLGLIVKDGRSKDRYRQSQTSLVDSSRIVGRQGDKDALVLKLLDDEPGKENFSIVPIVGIGGVGKTTLAKILYDDEQVKKHFKLKVWVCVSDEWDTFNMSNIIFQSVTGETKEFKDLNLLQVDLREQLREKLFLLVLDDVWSESIDDWESLVAPLKACAPGSKIIMTTRKEKLLRQLGCGKLNHLQRLSHEDAMCLFAHHALGANNFDSHPRLKAPGEGIVKKCDGLPLALIALGRLLRTNEDEVEWKEIEDSELWRLDDGGKIIPALRLSYHELPAYLKQLFAYCSLFPKDYAFEKQDLVLLWLAEGFLYQASPSKSTKERWGHKCFDELLSRSFFQPSSNDESLFVMHDLMNDLATSVAGEFYFRLEKELGKKVGKQALDKCRHLSFVCEEFVAYKKFEAFDGAIAKGLRTFLSAGVNETWQSNYLSSKVLVDLLPELQLLRVLSLSGYKISEVPEYIGKLKHLRYLLRTFLSAGVNETWQSNYLSSKVLVDLLPELQLLRVLSLSGYKISEVPEYIGKLKHLRYLNLSQTEITHLPENLKSLRHLDIRDTPLLKDLPLGVAKLKSLQTLSKIIIGGEIDFSITQLKNFENLHGKVSIEGLEKVKNATEAREANLSQKRLTDFEVEWSEASRITPMDTTENAILDALKPNNDCLKRLGIVNYLGLEFPKWVGDPSFCQLARVSIRGCKKCTSVPPLGQLQSLKELFIEGMDDVKVVGSEFFGTGLAFPSLESLSFRNMLGWEVWSTNSRSGVGDSVFPCLKELNIEGCPNLVEFSFEAPLPSLRVLKISWCGDGVLRSLVHVAPSVTTLIVGSISGLTNEVWRGVILDLKAVEELIVDSCNEIRYLWESKEAETGSKVLVNLKKLFVFNCKNLMSLGEKDEGEYNYGSNFLTPLRSLLLFGCYRFKHLSCANNIETLNISYCEPIKSVTFVSMGGGQKLKSVNIFGCKKLMLKELGEGGEKNKLVINSKSMPMLEHVWIEDHPNLASIIDFGVNFIHLTNLIIRDCKSTAESLFADHQLQSLTSLTTLEISNCPSMDVPTAGLWPPNLRKLEIGELKKPISEWGPQNFPFTLVDLTLVGTEEKEAATKLSHLHLPSSLTFLRIWNFKNLETVSEGLQRLTSLKHLEIRRCPKIKDLPEMLWPSLLSLQIPGSPGLQERCNRGGSYWPQISHIPYIKIDW